MGAAPTPDTADSTSALSKTIAAVDDALLAAFDASLVPPLQPTTPQSAMATSIADAEDVEDAAIRRAMLSPAGGKGHPNIDNATSSRIEETAITAVGGHGGYVSAIQKIVNGEEHRGT